MQVNVLTVDNGDAGTIELNEAIFGLEPRADILHRVVTWQRDKRRAGTHKAKTRGEINASKKKIYRQKGTGRARHGAKSANIFRGGGVAFPPVPRDHATDLPKKIRKLGLRMALSGKRAEGRLVVLESAAVPEGKTKALVQRLRALGLGSALIIDGAELDQNFARAARNLPDVVVLPEIGANVYDILRRESLVLTRAAVEALEARLS